MKFKLIFLSLIAYSSHLFSQTNERRDQDEIDSQVWVPFIKAYNHNDYTEFNKLHSDNIRRVGRWGILMGEEYKQRNIKSFKENDSLNIHREIEIWFDMRVAKGNYGYEVGYYKITTSKPGSSENEFHYGVFHVVLEKNRGVWEIVQDWDDSKIGDRELSNTDFMKATGRVYSE